MPKTQVAESVVELLHMEMVDYITNVSHKDSKDKAYIVLENLGFQVGQKMAARLTKDRPRFIDNLDIIKFLCKDFWMENFKKNVDNLRTNHKGTYVLHDSKFKFLQRISTIDSKETEELSKNYVTFTTGLIRGALNVLGVDAVVTAEIQSLPACNCFNYLKSKRFIQNSGK
jgi:trafficking protein particle complex subunit 6